METKVFVIPDALPEQRAPAPRQQLSPAARAPQRAVTGSPSYTSVPGTRAALRRGLSHPLRPKPGLGHRGVGVRFPLRRLGALGVRFAAGVGLRTFLSLSESNSAARYPFGTTWDRGQPGMLCHPGGLRHPISASHWDAGKEGEQGKGRSTLIAIREETQISAAFQPYFSSPCSSLTPPRFWQTALAAILCLGSAQIPQEPSHAAREISYVQS